MSRPSAVTASLPVLKTGARVSTPGGEIVFVTGVDGDDVYVINPGRRVGKGPWIWPRHSIVLDGGDQ